MTYALNRTRGAWLATELAVADSYFSRLRGLLGRGPEQFPDGAGLWIHPSQGVHALGMRFAIDAVYLNGDHRVVHLECNLRPGRLGAICRASAGVLELPAGTVERTQTALGDYVVFGATRGGPPVA